jgi:hypothetical protein
VDVAVVATNLVALAPLAKTGRLVILAHPLAWSPDAASAVAEIAERTVLSPDVAGLTASLAVAQQLKVHPYTIAESNRSYQRLLASRPTNIRQYDYDTFLAGLLSARLLTDARFDYVIDAPVERIPEIVRENADFYRQFRERLSSGGLDEGDFRLEVLAKEIEKIVKSRNARIRESAYDWATFGGTVAGIIGLIGATSSQDPILGLTGGLVSLSATLSRMFTRPTKDFGVIGSVFRRLKHSHEERFSAFDTFIHEGGDPSDLAADYFAAVPRHIGTRVAMQLDSETVRDLLNGPSDYVEGYLVSLFTLSPRVFWSQIQIGFEEFDGLSRDGQVAYRDLHNSPPCHIKW